MLRYKLRTLMIVLAVASAVLAIPWVMIENGRDSHDLWHNPARYRELEEHLVDRGVAKRGPNGELRPTPRAKDYAMFRFTIRELVLLTVTVALGVGWWVERARSDQMQERAYLEGAAEEKEIWMREFEKYREDRAKEAELVRKRYNIPYPTLPVDSN